MLGPHEKLLLDVTCAWNCILNCLDMSTLWIDKKKKSFFSSSLLSLFGFEMIYTSLSSHFLAIVEKKVCDIYILNKDFIFFLNSIVLLFIRVLMTLSSWIYDCDIDTSLHVLELFLLGQNGNMRGLKEKAFSE